MNLNLNVALSLQHVVTSYVLGVFRISLLKILKITSIALFVELLFYPSYIIKSKKTLNNWGGDKKIIKIEVFFCIYIFVLVQNNHNVFQTKKK